MKVLFIVVVLSVFFVPAVKAQGNEIHFNVETTGGYTSPDHVPFWLRSNQFGSIPLDNASLSFIGNVRKDYNNKKQGIFDWGASIVGRANIGNKSNFTLVEGYGKLRIGIFELRAGRTKEIIGLCDTSLSSGAFAVSGNALGIPKVQIGIPEFYSLPFFDKLFAFKGTFAHGWVGETPVRMLNRTIVNLKTYLHQKTFYGRFGQPDWKWKLYGGFNHHAYWGSESKYYGDNYTLSDLQCYFYVITGKAYGTDAFSASKIGNQLGSIDLGFDYNFQNARLYGYHQFFYDIGALYHLANLRDGLNGISLTNTRKDKNRTFIWKKVLLEFMYSKNQAGEFWSPVTPSGDENYYNNDQYIEGWSYQGIGSGTPFICTSDATREGLPSNPRDYFINNRVIALHFGFEGSLKNWNFVLKESFSLNYGTYGTGKEGHSIGLIHYPPLYGLFPERNQFSSYLETNKAFRNHTNFGIVGAFDVGDLYYNSYGLLIKFSKSF